MQIVGGILSGGWIIGSILFPLKRTRRVGFRSMIGLIGVIGINGVISLFRVDPAPRFSGLRWETWISLIILGVFTGAYLLKRKMLDDGKAETE